MARRNMVLRVTGQVLHGAMSVAFELEDDKGGYLQFATMAVTSGPNGGFEASADIGDVISLDTFDKAVKLAQDDRKAQTARILAAQAITDAAPALPAQQPTNLDVTGGSYLSEHGALVDVTAAGKPSKEQLAAPVPVTEATAPVPAPAIETPAPAPVVETPALVPDTTPTPAPQAGQGV